MQAVVLPWEQRRAGAHSQDDIAAGHAEGTEAAEMLPEQSASVPYSSGQHQQQGLGQILYERDSDTDPDSDEDPDDDLDF